MEENKKTFAHKKVLVVEDDQLLRGLITKKLIREGFDVKSSMDSQGVFRELANEKPDVILLDLILPGVDGFEILTRIKSEENLKDIPVLISSNLGQQEDIDRVMSLGALDFIVKANFTLDEIVKRVEKVFEDKIQ